MKKLSLISVSILLVSVFLGQPVRAESPGFGYIPLLHEGYDSSFPREYLSNQAYDSLLPELLRAQKSGEISDFEPDFYGGFIRVTMTGSSAASIGLEIFYDLTDALVKPIVSSQTNLKAPPELYISLSTYSNCFYVYGVATGTHILGQVFTGSHELVGAAEGLSDASLYYWDCFSGPFPTVIPGYSISFQIDIAGGDPLVYTTTVPRNTFTTITKSTASVAGTATPSVPYALDWYHAELDSENHMRMLREEGSIPASGNWSETYADKFRGGDQLVLILETDSVFHTSTSVYVPYFSCILRSPTCGYRGFPRSAVTMTVTHAGITYTFTGMTDKYGVYIISLENAAGAPVLLSSGDVVTATGAVNETLPALTIYVNRTTNKITGKAPLYNYFKVGFLYDGVSSPYEAWLKTDALGKYKADFTAVGIPDSELLKVEITYSPKRSGNITKLIKMVP